jgi:phage baseplate assembly protein W
MNGMHRHTGKALDGSAHLRQSIGDILSTPIGTRVMRRDYGSRLFDLIDAPINTATASACASAVGDALAKWEPRFRHRQTTVTAISTGRLSLVVHGVIVDSGATLALPLDISAR